MPDRRIVIERHDRRDLFLLFFGVPDDPIEFTPSELGKLRDLATVALMSWPGPPKVSGPEATPE